MDQNIDSSRFLWTYLTQNMTIYIKKDIKPTKYINTWVEMALAYSTWDQGLDIRIKYWFSISLLSWFEGISNSYLLMSILIHIDVHCWECFLKKNIWETTTKVFSDLKRKYHNTVCSNYFLPVISYFFKLQNDECFKVRSSTSPKYSTSKKSWWPIHISHQVQLHTTSVECGCKLSLPGLINSQEKPLSFETVSFNLTWWIGNYLTNGFIKTSLEIWFQRNEIK